MLCSPALLGCSDLVDTELGLVVELSDARISVDVTDRVDVEADIQYRVGTQTDGSRMFQPIAFDLWMSDEVVGTVSPNRPDGFVASVSPGQSVDLTFDGQSDVIAEPARLCAGAVRVAFRYLDQTTNTPGQADRSVDAADCE